MKTGLDDIQNKLKRHLKQVKTPLKTSENTIKNRWKHR